MTAPKPYADYKFLGVKPFTKSLDEAGITYTLFADPAIDFLFTARAGLFNRDTDVIEVGKCTNSDLNVYFAQFGIRITPSYNSFIVFIFDHHPTLDEMVETATGIEELIMRHLDGVDVNDIVSKKDAQS
ncbi:MAG: hypothetical protein EPN93_05465 [Spirochaetes bacterium]|nr:MAG: hypothetical protein EPN93_05465 [Spirochaetota bacterium]